MIELSKGMNMLKSKMMSLLPYFLLAVAVIIAYYAISEVRTIINYIVGAISWVGGIIAPFFYGFILAYILHMPFEAIQRLLWKIKVTEESKFKKLKRFIIKRTKAISLLMVIISLVLLIVLMSALISIV